MVVLLVIYLFFLLFIFAYSIMQLLLTLQYMRTGKNSKNPAEAHPAEWPDVTVQLPVFNERYVVERLIDCAAALDYPADKLQIQVSDDSTDDSFDIAAERISFHRERGVDIVHIRRAERTGFKAGALAHATESATGEFIAIFDADFLPGPDFLKKTIPLLVADSGLGVVQTRWTHLNENYSLLTRLQAFALDAHFTVEQTGRNAGGHFINFNGTAGVWRKQAITDSGGWQSDTLTEDLDLSYRAQLRGWRFRYLEEVGTPAELPAEMNALKNQQFRWTKGAAECAVKNLPSVLKSNRVKFSTKLFAVFHLLNSFVFVAILITALLSVPVLWLKPQMPALSGAFRWAGLFLLSFGILTVFYWMSLDKSLNGFAKFSHFIVRFPLFLSVSMGLSLHNALAVAEGYLGIKTPFIRTPKFALANRQGSWADKTYKVRRIAPLTVLEGLLVFYFAGGVALAFHLKDFGLLPFHLMLTVGYFYVFFYSVKHARSGS